MKVSAQYAEKHFADILDAVDRGEKVEITRPDKPSVFFVLSSAAPQPFKRTTPRILGAGVGERVVPSWEEWKAMDKETEREMLDAPLFRDV